MKKHAPGLERISVVALDLFAGDRIARKRAQDEAARRRWPRTWLETDGAVQEALGLPESEVPWALLVDEEGRVTAMVHAQASTGRAAVARGSARRGALTVRPLAGDRPVVRRIGR